MDLDAILESWGRQAQIVLNVAELVQPEDLDKAPSEGEWNIAHHLCHIHGTRRFWLSKVAPELLADSERLFDESGESPSHDLDRIRTELAKSGKSVADGFRKFVEQGNDDPTYAHPMHFLHHMLWHDGWHVGLIMLALRRAGKEPPEEWEEPNIWGLWRTEIWD